MVSRHTLLRFQLWSVPEKPVKFFRKPLEYQNMEPILAQLLPSSVELEHVSRSHKPLHRFGNGTISLLVTHMRSPFLYDAIIICHPFAPDHRFPSIHPLAPPLAG